MNVLMQRQELPPVEDIPVAQRRDYVGVAERGYWLHGRHVDWLGALMNRARWVLDSEAGVCAWGYRLATGSYDLEIVHPGFVDCRDGIPKMMEEVTAEIAALDDSEKLLHLLYRGPVCLPNTAAMGPPFAAVYHRWFESVGIGGFRMFRADCGDGTGICMASFRDDDRALNPSQVRALERTAAHIAAGYRIRRSLAPSQDTTDAGGALVDAEAVLSDGGRVLHAEGDAKPRDRRSSLQEAARGMALSRGSLRQDDSAAALELWRGLVAGRWSLLQHVDSDGKRLILAKRNMPDVADPKALAPEERQVASYAACGHSNKLIAYELGLHESTVSRRLDAAIRKLGFRSRVELVATMSSARSQGSPDETDET